MTLRIFIVCHLLDLPKMLKSTCPVKYAMYNNLRIIDGQREEMQHEWHKLMKLRGIQRKDTRKQ